MSSELPEAVKAPFFIVGCRRSGTTLVSRLLDSHSRLAVYHETYFYPIFRPELAWYGDLRTPENLNRFIEDVRVTLRAPDFEPSAADIRHVLERPTFEAVLAAVLHLYARQVGASRGGDKTPEHCSFLPEILDHFPASPVIVVMRDPRDTVHSILRTFGTSLADATRSWNEAWLAYERAKERVHLVRYESLVSAPRQEVATLCEVVGEPLEENMFQFFDRLPDLLRGHAGGEKLAAAVTTSSIGNFRSLPESDIRRIERECGAGMAAMGYEFSGRGPAVLRRPVLLPARRRPFLTHAVERLRYYGTNAERWHRGALRWKMMLRVRARYFARLGSFRGRAG